MMADSYSRSWVTMVQHPKTCHNQWRSCSYANCCHYKGTFGVTSYAMAAWMWQQLNTCKGIKLPQLRHWPQLWFLVFQLHTESPQKCPCSGNNLPKSCYATEHIRLKKEEQEPFLSARQKGKMKSDQDQQGRPNSSRKGKRRQKMQRPGIVQETEEYYIRLLWGGKLDWGYDGIGGTTGGFRLIWKYQVFFLLLSPSAAAAAGTTTTISAAAAITFSSFWDFFDFFQSIHLFLFSPCILSDYYDYYYYCCCYYYYYYYYCCCCCCWFHYFLFFLLLLFLLFLLFLTFFLTFFFFFFFFFFFYLI